MNFLSIFPFQNHPVSRYELFNFRIFCYCSNFSSPTTIFMDGDRPPFRDLIFDLVAYILYYALFGLGNAVLALTILFVLLILLAGFACYRTGGIVCRAGGAVLQWFRSSDAIPPDSELMQRREDGKIVAATILIAKNVEYCHSTNF